MDSAPATPYTVNYKGQGPSWANSLFEDNAEFGMGMYLGVKQTRERLADAANKLVESDVSAELKTAAKDWVDNINEADGSKAATAKIVPLLEAEKDKMNIQKKYLKKKII